MPYLITVTPGCTAPHYPVPAGDIDCPCADVERHAVETVDAGAELVRAIVEPKAADAGRTVYQHVGDVYSLFHYNGDSVTVPADGTIITVEKVSAAELYALVFGKPAELYEFPRQQYPRLVAAFNAGQVPA